MSAIYKHEVWHWFSIFTLKNSLYVSVDLYICVCCLSLWICAHKCRCLCRGQRYWDPLDLELDYYEPHDIGILCKSSWAISPYLVIEIWLWQQICFGYSEHLCGIYLEAQHVLMTVKIHCFLCKTNLNGGLQIAWYRTLTVLSCLGRDKA